jgi:SAM-dependent methyltransferase
LRDRTALRHEQYVDDSRLNARFDLHRRFQTVTGSLHRWVFDQLMLPERARVLELGCGPGHLWAANEERVPRGWTVVLTDLSPGMIHAARRRLGDRFVYVLADADALPHPAGRFHAVIANHMLYHVRDLPRTVREIARVLRPDGALYAVTNGGGHLRELDELASRWMPPGTLNRAAAGFRLEDGPEHLRAGFAEVEMVAREGGLRITEADPVAAYVRSLMPGGWDAEPLRREAAAIIEREGVLSVRTRTGLLVARSPIQSRS